MTSRQWQLAGDAATRYEQVLVPSILGPFAEALVNWADLAGADYVVDIGCGTGAATRCAAEQVGDNARVVGTDINMGMLRVAHTLANGFGPEIDWRQESAYEISIGDNQADIVLCAQTLQFLDKPQKALEEMRRILIPGGAAYISLWCEIQHSPYFDALVHTIARYISEDTAAGLGSAFKLSDLDKIMALCEGAGFTHRESTVAELQLELPPLTEFVPRHIQATPMGIGFNEASTETQQAVVTDMVGHLSQYQTDTGIRVPFQSYLIKATK